ncbi:CinA family protein [Ureaplasma ceti]|uniref:CinA C-terminal domain-containing protein n=1 Tax=Ureaplasma ceti TaxID=3119530 RepID=A0ABP9U950_9BACT
MTAKIDNLISLLKKGKITLTTAESASCGEVANILGSYKGISQIYKGGFITYWTEMKTTLLGIPADFIAKHGVVSSEVAYHMARQAALKTKSQIGVSITGNAGPTVLDNKPVGNFFIGISNFNKTVCYEIQLDSQNSREQNRKEIAIKALELLYDYLVK